MTIARCSAVLFRSPILRLCLALSFVLAIVASPFSSAVPTAQAAPSARIIVTSASDDNPYIADNVLTLREAIQLANYGPAAFGALHGLSNAEFDACCSHGTPGPGSADTIVFSEITVVGSYFILVQCADYAVGDPAFQLNLAASNDTIDASLNQDGDTITSPREVELSPASSACESGADKRNGLSITGNGETVRGLSFATNSSSDGFQNDVVVVGANATIEPGYGKVNNRNNPVQVGCNLNGAGGVGGGPSGNGLVVNSGGGLLIQGCFIGTDASGTDFGNANHGVLISNGSSTSIGLAGGSPNFGLPNVIGYNGNSTTHGDGIFITGGSGTIVNNYIGISYGLSAKNGNDGDGVGNSGGSFAIGNGQASGVNFIGGNGAGTASGNGVNYAASASSGTIDMNYIGVNGVGTVDLGNDGNGILIADSQVAVTIIRNTIGNSGSNGIFLNGGAYGTQIGVSGGTARGNYIGTDASGNDVGNARSGIRVDQVGNDSLIQANTIRFNGSSASDAGIFVQNGRTTTIGSPTEALHNTIGNQQNNAHGVLLMGGTTNTLQGNYIGTDSDGNSHPNDGDGIHVNINSASSTNTLSNDIIRFNDDSGINIDGTASHDVTNNIGPGDTISDNGGAGVVVNSGCGTSNTCNNNIGISGADNTIDSNGTSGVDLKGGDTNVVGATTGNQNDGPGAGGDNTITNNGVNGIFIDNAGTNTVNDNTITGNNTSNIISNAGIRIDSGTGHTIGGSGNGNTISGNLQANIKLNGSAGATINGNTIQNAASPNLYFSGTSTGTVTGNSITGASAENVLSESTGIVTIGGTGSSDGNTITGANGAGIATFGAGTKTLMERNLYGGNGGLGIDLDEDGNACGTPTSNGGIKCPVITSAKPSADVVSGTYDVGTCPLVTCRIEVYSVDSSSDVAGEGTAFLGIATLGAGTWTFSTPVDQGDRFGATASDTNVVAPHTSEFSLNLLGSEFNFQPDGQFPGVNGKKKNSPAPVNGANSYGAKDTGDGGANAQTDKGPGLKKPSVSQTKTLTIPFKLDNDGNMGDTIRYESIHCYTRTKNTLYPAPPAGNCDTALNNTITVRVFGPSNDVGTDFAINPLQSKSGSITVTFTNGVAQGLYKLHLNFQSQGDTSVYDSVSIYFQIE